MTTVPKKLLDLENLLQQGRHREIGQLLIELQLGKSTVDLISSKILNQIAESYTEDVYDDIEEFLEETPNPFSWGSMFEEDGLNMRELDDHATELKISAFKGADDLTQALFKSFYSQEYQCLIKLQQKNLLDSWSCIAAHGPPDPYFGYHRRGLWVFVSRDDYPASVLKPEEKLLFADAAEFNFLNWSLLDQNAESFNCPYCNGESETEGSQSRYQNCTKDGCPNGELIFTSGMDMALQCYTTENQSIILAVGGYGQPGEDALDNLTNKCVPYVAGTLAPSDILTITTFSWDQYWSAQSEEEIKTQLDTDRVLELALDRQEEYLVIGWIDAINYDGAITPENLNDFTQAISSLKNWMSLKPKKPIPTLTIHGTLYVTLIRQQAKSRFRDYVNSILQGQVYFGRDQVVKDSRDSEYLARIAAEEDDHYVLEEIAKNKFTPQDTLKELSENESVSVRFALLENPNLNADLKSKINREKEISDAIANREKEISDAIANREKEREKEISDAIWDLFTNAGIKGLTLQELCVFVRMVQSKQYTLLALSESLREILYGTSKGFAFRFKRMKFNFHYDLHYLRLVIKRQGSKDRSLTAIVWAIVNDLGKSGSLHTSEVQRRDQPGDENTVLYIAHFRDEYWRETDESESEEIRIQKLRRLWKES